MLLLFVWVTLRILKEQEVGEVFCFCSGLSFLILVLFCQKKKSISVIGAQKIALDDTYGVGFPKLN